MEAQEKRDKHKSLTDRLVRWQLLTQSQLSFTNNLFMGMNLAFFGFFIAETEMLFSSMRWHLVVQVFAIVGLGVSFFAGVLTVWNRLRDFRLTTELVKSRKLKFEHDHRIKTHSNIEAIKARIELNESLTDKLGERTWALLNWQMWAFLIGVLFGVLFLVVDKNTYR